MKSLIIIKHDHIDNPYVPEWCTDDPLEAVRFIRKNSESESWYDMHIYSDYGMVYGADLHHLVFAMYQLMVDYNPDFEHWNYPIYHEFHFRPSPNYDWDSDDYEIDRWVYAALEEYYYGRK